MILLDDVDIDVINSVDVTSIYGEGAALGVAESAGIKGFMVGTEESTMHLEGTEGKAVGAFIGCPVV